PGHGNVGTSRRRGGEMNRLSPRTAVVALLLFFGALPAQAAAPIPAAPDAQIRPLERITAYSPPPAIREKSSAAARARYRFYFASALYGLLAPLALLLLRIGVRYRALAERTSARRAVQVLIYAPLFLGTLALLGLPMDAW